jgi:rhamnose transport system ATP-binding protein
MPPPSLLRLESVSKNFGATRALKPLSLDIEAGRVIGLIGENGAGKSTLIKILSGVHKPDTGKIFLEEKQVSISNPHQAVAYGIATIHQELASFEWLTVSENLLLDELWPRKAFCFVDWPRLHQKAAERLRGFEIDLDPRAKLNSLSSAQRQELAIVRALSKKARLLILDEPTASLTEPEVQRLLAKIKQLRASGIAVLYVSHRLDEILQIADQIVVLRDGELVAQYPTAQANVNRMVHDMVGRKIEEQYARKKQHSIGEPILQVERVTREPFFRDISFELRTGEITGLAGLIGAGRSELARAIFGLYPPDSGTLRLRGKPFRPKSSSESVASGIAYLPEERKRQGFAPQNSVRDAITMVLLRSLSRLGLVNSKQQTKVAAEAISKFSIRAGSQEQKIGSLSGGNQQKALLARWLETHPDLIILDEPTRGVDVGAKAEIHRIIDELARAGKAVLLISSDLPEVISLSDRVLVLHQGRLVKELHPPEISQENILLAASGFSSLDNPPSPHKLRP